jgi:hypothetical protein
MKSEIRYNSIACVDDFDAGVYTIAELREILDRLAVEHPLTGERTLLEFDAGYNNICLDVVEKTIVKTR